MTRLRLIPAAALLALAACGGEAAKSETEAAAPAGQNDAQRAATIALALQAMPDKIDSILAANSLTAAQLEALMFRVAQDSTLSAEYSRLTVR
jgi:ABC-type glycerol-3-phosphate transport system substrate-binding protein